MYIMSCKLTTPVVFIIFSRKDTTQAVFDIIREMKPPKLLVIGDGPRPNKPGEAEKVAETRAIIQQVDWECEVHTNFSDVNLGCRKRISGGLDWAFSIVDEAIILEDDCIATKSFFQYCQELLEKYRNDTRIMLISGDNKSFSKEELDTSYYFTRQVQIWGWATWKRAWEKMDINMTDWPEIDKKGFMNQYSPNKAFNFYWCQLFRLLYEHRIDSWAGPWVYSVWKESGLSIAPKYNLISNIGFGQEATHTNDKSVFDSMGTKDLEFPLVHPEYVMADSVRDNREMKIRLKDAKRLPYPLDMWASKLKWFIIKRLLKK